MYVCMYVCVYIYIYIYIHEHIIVTGFQAGSGRIGFSQKGHKFLHFWNMLFYERAFCHMLADVDILCHSLI